MARHRIGDTYLSEEEYEAHVDSSWKFWLFVIGALFSAIAVFVAVSSVDIHKGFKFTIVIATAMVSGWSLSYFSKFIQMALALAVVGGVVVGIGVLIWNLL